MPTMRIIIPARMNSTRLPNKPLAMIGDRTLIEHVHSKACATDYPVTVLTDSSELKNRFPNWDVRLTPEACATGTDRIAWIANDFEEDILVNCQGDLPFIDPYQIVDSALTLERTGADVATLIHELSPGSEKDPNTVKAICCQVAPDIDPNIMRAHWFCRASLNYGYQHAGVYAYKKQSLLILPNERTPHEIAENLEQLRWIELGYKIAALKTTVIPPEVNTEEDLVRANNYYNRR
jgi:3-deoxy-manno-octulosonate cytidylyltransferase (CMP-KDO synthetase)